ncbi:u3 snornp-associated protein esf2 [Ophiostoma piceae UAMH 11346]|uniref:18S rRNA factor 2 n=1 Tax=Ophiostoma piceae (strain UAMH 11346) TaxID=1262450 RepID=S3CB42_OPHP1|nr:u3 snornp-associated protein esf2 [Ophiostoma piceae UAMH 11346]
MAPEKRNNFLDAGDSDEEDDRYNSDDDDMRKGGRSVKRRKVDDDEDLDESDGDASVAGDESDDEESDQGARIAKITAKKANSQDDDEEEEEDEDAEELGGEEEGDDIKATKSDKSGKKDKKDKKKSKSKSDDDSSDEDNTITLPGATKPLAKKNLVSTAKAIRRSGVVYISRIPPFMRPGKLRTLLEPYGKINRTYLTPEDPLSHTRRVRGGGNKRRSFVDGWVEFVRKKDAKRCVDLLNAQTIGGKKGSYYRDDIWSMVYLRGFKWHNLAEQIATENAERASRMRAELEKTARENKLFLQNVERAKMLDGMDIKAAAKASRTGGDAAAPAAAPSAAPSAPASAAPKETRKDKRSIKQKKMVSRVDKERQPEHVTRVLSQIF